MQYMNDANVIHGHTCKINMVDVQLCTEYSKIRGWKTITIILNVVLQVAVIESFIKYTVLQAINRRILAKQWCKKHNEVMCVKSIEMCVRSGNNSGGVVTGKHRVNILSKCKFLRL